MRTWLKVVFAVAGVAVAGLLVLFLAYDEDLPRGEVGLEAEALADRLLAAVDKPAWDTTAFVAWDFAGRQRYRWRRDVDTVEVRWGGVRVDLHTETVTGVAYRDGERVLGDDADELVREAWAHFCNDSFWLAAPFKVRDPGTTREAVPLPLGGDGEGGTGLLVRYASGGVTPGDAYLWELGDDGRPVAYRMWTSIIPVGGVRATWADWTRLPSGAWVAERHAIGPVDLVVDVEE